MKETKRVCLGDFVAFLCGILMKRSGVSTYQEGIGCSVIYISIGESMSYNAQEGEVMYSITVDAMWREPELWLRHDKSLQAVGQSLIGE